MNKRKQIMEHMVTAVGLQTARAIRDTVGGNYGAVNKMLGAMVTCGLLRREWVEVERTRMGMRNVVSVWGYSLP